MLMDRDLIIQLSKDQRSSVEAAAYVLYTQMKPANKKLLSRKEFHEEFKENWMIFEKFEEEERSE